MIGLLIPPYVKQASLVNISQTPYIVKPLRGSWPLYSDMISNAQLDAFNRQGLIPGPDETEEEFLERANYCLELKTSLPTPFENVSKEDLELGDSCVKQAFSLTEKIYDIVPEWIPLFFSNYRLAPWHGGCAWIFQFSEETPCAAFFQLRRAFKQASHYLGIYDRNELIAHELTHASRMMFQEPRFEEIIAYQSASSPFGVGLDLSSNRHRKA